LVDFQDRQRDFSEGIEPTIFASAMAIFVPSDDEKALTMPIAQDFL